MVLNDTLVVFADANPVDVLRAYPVLDKPATRLLAERLFPGATIEEIGDVLLADALNPPEDVAYIGSFANLDLVCSWRLMPDRPSQLGKEVLAASERRQVFLHAMHSEAEWCLYGLWQDGTRIRALSVCPDPGVIEDEGEKLGFELPYWAGDHPPETPNTLPFGPVELGETALRSLFGFTEDGEERMDDVDPELIPVVAYRITD